MGEDRRMKEPKIAVIGTFDSKGREHQFLKQRIEERGLPAITINVGTKNPSPLPVDIDMFKRLQSIHGKESLERDMAIEWVLQETAKVVKELYLNGEIAGVISAGGGTGTHLCTGIMKALPFGVPKIMISTVASKDMSGIVETKDITMIHSVVDILGVNSILGNILDRSAGAICGMVKRSWVPDSQRKRVAITMFGFITKASEQISALLEDKGYEPVTFHANGTGGMAMEELAREDFFCAIMDLATHEFADELKGGYCKGIGPMRLEPIEDRRVPRLVIPGGLDCAVLEFTRESIPDEYQGRKIFFYDFRSAIRLSREETVFIARQIATKLNMNPQHVKVLIPLRGWSEADIQGGPLYAPEIQALFISTLKDVLSPKIEVIEHDSHINDPEFARISVDIMDQMIADIR